MKKIALLSNVTVDLIASRLKNDIESYIPTGFNAWQQEILNPLAGIYTSGIDAVFIVLYADESEDAWGSYKEGKLLLDDWNESIKTLCEKMKSVPVFVSSLDIKRSAICSASESDETVKLEAYWTGLIEEMGEAYIFPLKDCIADVGRDSFYQRKMWYLGSCPYSLKGSKALAELMSRYCSIAFGTKKKCIAVDLDNTLWGGVAGEDGVDGITLSNHKEGARFYHLQKSLLRMKSRGVMLAVISKNNPEDVDEVFEKHPYMLLKKDDFVAMSVNWESKSSNIRSMAEGLNIGLDSFLFLDDDPVERAQMEAECPEVTVIDFPKDTSDLPQLMEEVYEGYFKSLDTTNEDLSKTEQYRQEAKRAESRKSAITLDDYLSGLEIHVDIHRMKSDEEVRVAQLIEKTNQFNLTTKRYSQSEVHELSTFEDSDVIVARMKDKFGDEGLVSVMVLKYDADTVDIDSFLMSCRVMNRGLEDVMVQKVAEWMRSEKPELKWVRGHYIKTFKNKPVEELYDDMGFTLVADGDLKMYRIGIDDLQVNLAPYREIRSFEEE